MRCTWLGILTASLGAMNCGDDAGSGNRNQTNQNNNQVALCGNGVIESAEACDDGAGNSDVAPDACRTDCTAARCGDGATDTGEECDEGPRNSDVVPDACRTDCAEAHCGDGVVDVGTGETCDHGGTPTATCGIACQAPIRRRKETFPGLSA